MKELHHNSILDGVNQLGYFHMLSLKDSQYSLVLSEVNICLNDVVCHRIITQNASHWQLTVKFGIHKPQAM